MTRRSSQKNIQKKNPLDSQSDIFPGRMVKKSLQAEPAGDPAGLRSGGRAPINAAPSLQIPGTKKPLRNHMSTLLPKKKHEGAVMPRSTRPIPLAAAAACLAGLLFCLWVFFTGGRSLCLTDGCVLFQDFRLAGISLWQAGAVLFAALLALTLLRLSRIALLLATLALAADVVLLCIMLFTAPCVNCLIVASLIALSFVTFRRAKEPAPRERSPLLVLWSVLLIIDLGGVLRDLAEPWSPLESGSEASVQIYFSPSCPACRTLLEHADGLTDAAWYPVAENERDILVIAAMTKYLEKGLSMAKAVEEADESVPFVAEGESRFSLSLLRPDRLLLQVRLWRNHAHVLGAGSDRLPFLEFKGLPAFLMDAPEPEADEVAPGEAYPAPDFVLPGQHDIPSIPGLNVAGFCDGSGETPCEDGTTEAPSHGLIDTSGMIPQGS